MRSSASKRLDQSLKTHCELLRVFAGLDRDGRELPATAENVASARTAAAQFASLQTKVLRLAKKKGAVDYVVQMAHPALYSHLPEGRAKFFLEDCYPILTRAHDKFLASRGSLASAHEQSLCELFVHLKHHENFYFREFFASDYTNPWMDRCVGMLGTYATLLRQRGEFHACFEVLKVDSRILARLTEVVTSDNMGQYGVARQMEVDNLKGLTYKFLLIKTNLRADLSLPLARGMAPHEEIGAELRIMIMYEIETDAAAQGADNALTVLELTGYPPTMEGLAKATDRELWEANEDAQRLQRQMMALPQHKNRHGATFRPMQGRVEHHVCAGCGRAEPYVIAIARLPCTPGTTHRSCDERSTYHNESSSTRRNLTTIARGWCVCSLPLCCLQVPQLFSTLRRVQGRVLPLPRVPEEALDGGRAQAGVQGAGRAAQAAGGRTPGARCRGDDGRGRSVRRRGGTRGARRGSWNWDGGADGSDGAVAWAGDGASAERVAGHSDCEQQQDGSGWRANRGENGRWPGARGKAREFARGDEVVLSCEWCSGGGVVEWRG
jgi:hypothetical protein